MQGSISYQLENNKLISLPVPGDGVAYAVVETDDEVCVFFGMKRPGVESPQDILERCQKQAPGLFWKLYPCAETGSRTGSPHAFEQYRLLKREGKLVLDVEGLGDMVTAFQQIGGDQSPSARAVADIEAVLEGLLGGESLA